MDNLDSKSRRQLGLPYFCDKEMLAEQAKCRELLAQFNVCPFEASEERERLIRAILGKVGAAPWINAPFRCDYGYNIHVGDDLICNYNCVILDVTTVTIGSRVQIGPNVTISTAGHPVHPKTRALGFEFGKPITIGDDVWIGAGTVINPGVSIGNGAVIGSGSVVTRDIPPMVVAVGAPCKVLREITDADLDLYYKNEHYDPSQLSK